MGDYQFPWRPRSNLRNAMQIRLSDTDLALIESAAERLGLPPSTYARRCIAAQAKRDLQPIIEDVDDGS